MTLDEMGKRANKVADEFSPAMLAGEHTTLLVIVCNGEGWGMALRGSLPHALGALHGAIEDINSNGDKWPSYNPVSA